MANINLLPWREELRAEKQRQFLILLVLSGLLGLVVMYAIYSFYDNKISSQTERNTLLQTEIKTLDSKIIEIKSLEAERKELVDRMELIQNLQKSRPQIVHLFDEIVKKIPEGMNMTRIERKGDVIYFTGVAESNPRVSNFMRNLAGSAWVSNPELDGIQEDKSSGSGSKVFKLRTTITAPTDEGEANSRGAE